MKTCYATFTGKNGYPYQNKRANEILTVGKRYKVIGGEMGTYHTSLKLEGESGEWNSVMFDIEGEFPFSFEDSYIRTPPKLDH